MADKKTNMTLNSNNLEQFNKKIKIILDNHKTTPYEKKIALFKLIENLEVGETRIEEKKRVDYLLKAHLYSDLAKQSMENYKKTTVEDFSNSKQSKQL